MNKKRIITKETRDKMSKAHLGKIDNGRTLCIPCHKTTETYGNKNQN